MKVYGPTIRNKEPLPSARRRPVPARRPAAAAPKPALFSPMQAKRFAEESIPAIVASTVRSIEAEFGVTVSPAARAALAANALDAILSRVKR